MVDPLAREHAASAARFPRTVWLIWSFALTTIMAGLAVVVWKQAESLIILTFLVIGPLFAAIRLSARQTTLVAVYALALGLAVVLTRTHTIDFNNAVRLALVIIGSSFAVWIAYLRRSREAAAALLGAVFDSAPLGLAIYDASGKFIQANQYLAVQTGQAVGDLLGLRNEEIWPSHDGERAANCFQQVIASGEPILDEAFVRENPSDPTHPRQLRASFFPVLARSGALLGVGVAASDITERYRVEEQLRQREAIQAATLETSLDCIITIDAEGKIVEFNPAAEQTFGYRRQEALGQKMVELIIPERYRDQHRAGMERYLATGKSRVLGQRLELEALDNTGREFAVELSLTRLPGDPIMFTGYLRDISDRQHADDEARSAAKRARFIADASAILNRNLDYRQTLSEVAHLLVPQLADWCMIHVVENQRLECLALAHIDTERERQGQALLAAFPVSVEQPDHTGLSEVLQNQQSQFWPQVAQADLEQLFVQPTLVSGIAELELTSALMVPLVAKGSILGLLTLATDSPERLFDDRDRVLAEDLAGRAASAITNARLYDERAQIAQALQQSLLPPTLPRLPGLEIAARYEAVGEGSEVGGDFYDAFPVGDDSWIVLVGDVEGKGAEAAALVALVHYSLHTIALQEQSPAGMLTRLNEAILAQRDDGRFCTLALAQLRLQPDRSIAGRLALGGHPYPLVKRVNGQVEQIGTPGMMVGITPAFEVENANFQLAPGETMLLYSDGISEARREGVMLGDQGVMQLFGQCSATEPDDIVGYLQDEALRWQDDQLLDDLALLAVRVPERQPVAWRQRFPARPEAVSDIRRGLEAALRQRPDINLATLNLLISELAANAILYGQHDLSGEMIMIEARITASETRLRCEIINRGAPFTEDASDPGLEAEGGRGLFLVSQLSDRWGKEETTAAGRTRVWFEVDIPLPNTEELTLPDLTVELDIDLDNLNIPGNW